MSWAGIKKHRGQEKLREGEETKEPSKAVTFNCHVRQWRLSWDTTWGRSFFGKSIVLPKVACHHNASGIANQLEA